MPKERTDLKSQIARLEKEVNFLKQTEGQLSSSLAMYRDFVEDTEDIITRVDSDGNFTFVNSSAEKIFGLKPEECFGLSAFSFVHPDDQQETIDRFQKYINEKAVIGTFENRQVSRNGNTTFMLWTTKFQYDKKGKLISGNGIGRDITENKEIEKYLIRAKQDWEKTFDAVQDPVMIVDANFRMQRVNLAMAKRLGLTPQELVGRKCYQEINYCKDNPVQNCPHRAFLADGESHSLSIYLKKFGGHYHKSVFPIQDSKGKLTGSVHIFRDINEQKKIEEALQESEERFRSIMEHSPSVIELYDQDGLQTYVNRAYENLWGFPASHTVNKFNVLKSKEVEKTGLLEYVKKAYVGEVVNVPVYKFDPQGDTEAQGEGRVRWLRTRIYPLKDKNGAVENIVITHEDISEIKHAEDQRRELETQLRQTSKMEAIGTLAGGIAHDFNNILGIILGYAEMAQEDAPRSTTVAYQIDAIIKAGKRGKDLVKNILTFSRKSDQETVPVRLDLLVKESVKLFRASIPANIEVLHDIKAPFSTIMADPSEVNQVLMNLIANATHAMEEKGGTLRIQVDCIELSSDEVHAAGDIEAGPFIKLTVTDTGDGMDEQTVERIFEPFYTTKKMEKGTGMGLSVVHGIVTKLGGFIKVDSKPGQGTNFDVYFPEFNDKASLQYEEDLQVPRGSEHVLFVDDEQMMVEMGQALLERLGYWVTVNTSPEKALEIFRKDPYGFDLLITDQTMPEMTGMQLAKELLRIRPDMPIVLCTGYSKTISEEEVKALGIREFAMKPLEMKKMAEIIRRVLDANN